MRTERYTADGYKWVDVATPKSEKIASEVKLRAECREKEKRELEKKVKEENSKKEKEKKEYKVYKTLAFNYIECSFPKPAKIFITEGEADAMSIIKAGGKAIGMGANANLFEKEISKGNRKHEYLLCLSNDDNGREATKIVSEILTRLKIKHKDVSKELLEGVKDPNEALLRDREELCQKVKRLS